jgi:hypothetical protein
MILGIDFDNTIVCYDNAFYRCALGKGLIPRSLNPAKNEIRDYLRKNGQEEEWIELQGLVYGACMHEADPFPGVSGFFDTCNKLGITVYIISHKTRYPYCGTQYDLHKATYDWIADQHFFSKGTSTRPDNVFLELTKEEKSQRIIRQKCTHFIDDLPEFLSDTSFPPEVHRILFDPHHLHDDADVDTHIHSWNDMSHWITARVSP